MIRGVAFALLLFFCGVVATAGAVDSAATASPTPVPGAFHLLFMDAGRLQMQPGDAPILDRFDADLIQKLNALLPGARITVAAAANDRPATIAQACADNSAIGVIFAIPDWRTQANVVSATIAIDDCYGQVQYNPSKLKYVTLSTDPALRDRQIIAALDDLSDQAIAQIRGQPLSAGRLADFLKYGYLLAPGERRAAFRLAPDPAGARVTIDPPFGSAARAGLRLGDLVTAINGRPTVGLSFNQLQSAITALQSAPNKYVLDVQAADGSKTTLTFEAEDVAWYAAQPRVVLGSATPTPPQSSDPTVAQLRALLTTGEHSLANGDANGALQSEQQALSLARKVGDREYEARALGDVGNVHLQLAQYPAAQSELHQALAIARQLGLHDVEATALVSIGAVLDRTAYYDDAAGYLQQAVQLSEQLNRGDIQERALFQVGDVYYRKGDFGRALASFEIALRIAIAGRDTGGEASARENLGNVLAALSRFPQALDSYRAALEVSRQLSRPDFEAGVLSNIGGVQGSLGRYADALESENESVALARQVKDPATEAVSQARIAAIQWNLGSFTDALASVNAALQTQRTINDPGRVAEDLNLHALIELDLGAYGEAEPDLRQAFAMATQIGSQQSIGVNLSYLGRLRADQEQYSAALDMYGRAATVFDKLGQRALEGTVAWASADALLHLHRYGDALASAQHAIALAHAVGAPAWRALSAAAHAQAALGDYRDAITNYDAAINEIEQLRGALPDLGSRTSFFAQALSVYDDYIAYLLELDRRFPGKGYDRKAFEVFERRQARTLLEEISQSAAHAFSGVPQTISDQDATNTAEIAHLRASLVQASTAATTASLQGELATVQRRQHALEQEIRAHYPAYYALQHPRPIDIATLQRHVLRPGEAMLVYDVLADRTALWVITPTAFRLFDLGHGDAGVRASVAAFLSATTAVQSAIDSGLSPSAVRRLAAQTLPQFDDASSALYAALFPVAARTMIAPSTDLFIVPTHALYGVPFEALATQTTGKPMRYLLEDHAISYLSSASLLGVLRSGVEERRRIAQRPLVAFANPSFTEAATPLPSTTPGLNMLQTRSVSHLVSRGGDTPVFPPLPGSQIEAEAVAKTVHAASADIYLGEQASVATVNRLNANGGLRGFRYVLFATHAALPDTVSGIAQPTLVLSHPASGGLLTMGDVFGLSLDAQLVMLSACESGGGVTTKGEGVRGLTQAFMYAGTPLVSVTKWEVVDDVAERFTPDVFERMREHAPPALALRAAKLAMIRGSDDMLRHPFFWAPTVLFGDGANAGK